jgi:PIN domain nuclease of toxin-antitoxin system
MIVLDTHIWHWWINQIPEKLSPATLALIEEADEVGISAISCFEMAWLVRHGRIDLSMSFEHWFSEVKNSTGIQILPVTAQIAIQPAVLPEHHKDPQDRIIISTALMYNAHLLSYDSAFSAYREIDGRLIGKNSF